MEEAILASRSYEPEAESARLTVNKSQGRAHGRGDVLPPAAGAKHALLLKAPALRFSLRLLGSWEMLGPRGVQRGSEANTTTVGFRTGKVPT